LENAANETFETLSLVELQDVNRLGIVRDTWDKELLDPDDVFRLAAERKKQLSKQGKKPRK
jgi:hypothetical protein